LTINTNASWRERSKRVRLSVGKDAQDAAARRLKKGAELNAVSKGVAVVPENGNGQRPRAGTVAEYLEEVKLNKKPETHATCSTALAYFVESCHKVNLQGVDRRDLLKFAAFLREKEQAPRSAYNKFENVMTFLKAQGIRGLVGRMTGPDSWKKNLRCMKRRTRKAVHGCNRDEQLWYEFFLMTGMREQEVMHVSWADVNLTRNAVTVRHKPEYGFSPKN
jgi:integrase/recombinase XerD